MSRVVAGAVPGGAVLALVEDERLSEIRDAREGTGRLELGRVTAIDRHLDAAFLDVGEGEPVFLAAKDARHLKGARGPAHKLLREGERVIVQALRPAGDGKGRRVTTDIVLDGPSLAYRPFAREPGVSPRARGRLRDDLLKRAQNLFPSTGFTLRPAAAALDDAALIEAAKRLEAEWRSIEAAAKRGGSLPRPHPIEGQIYRLLEHPIETIETVDPALHVRLKRLLDALPEEVRPELVRLDGDDAFAAAGIDDDLALARAREVPIVGGGRVIIEQTAACVAIDVDGGGRGALDVDLDAAAEIGRQVRLRNLGGTLIVDFVDLPTKPQRQRLDEALRRAFKHDPLPVQIYPMSPLGIVQIGRAKRGGSMLDPLSAVCPRCGGDGRVITENR